MSDIDPVSGGIIIPDELTPILEKWISGEIVRQDLRVTFNPETGERVSEVTTYYGDGRKVVTP